MQAPGHVYSRLELEHMKRADIQRLCKDYGVRANMKTEALIALLLDTQSSNMSPLVPPPPRPTSQLIRRTSTRSRTSSRTASMRTRGTSGSSVVIRDVDEESTQTNQTDVETSPREVEEAAPTPRSRKAKDSQYRLGVGRPVVAGGSGARAVTRSLNNSKSKRGRSSRSIRPIEDTIEEEPEQSYLVSAQQETGRDPPPQGVRDSSSQESETAIASRLERLEFWLRDADFKQHFESLKDIPEQTAWLKRSLQQREVEIKFLHGELNAHKIEIVALRDEIKRISSLEGKLNFMIEMSGKGAWSAQSTSPSKGCLTRRVSIPFGESNTNTINSGRVLSENQTNNPSESFQSKDPVPGPTATNLGKRRRNSNSSTMTGVIDAEEGKDMSEIDLIKRVLRPNRKRAKTGESRSDGRVPLRTVALRIDPDSQSSEQEANLSGSASSTSDPSTAPPVGTPPPTDHLPVYFGASLEGHTRAADEDAEALASDPSLLGFSFSHATSSTPRDNAFNFHNASFNPDFTPGPGKRAPSGNGSTLQPSVFGARRAISGTTRPRTPTRQHEDFGYADQYVGSPLGGLDDDAFGFHFGQNDGNSYARSGAFPLPMPIAVGLGLSSTVPGTSGPESPARPIQRTMYGTELQNDTRFGDFGRDGIASASNMDYWLGGGAF